MKSLMTIMMQFMKDRPTRLNAIALFRFLLLVTALVIVYSIIFHYIMEYEGRQESWVTGVYWTLTVMSTLGFGDITFQSDIGKIFSSIVLMSGVIFLLILLPFTFIEFFYAPWMKAQESARAPRELGEKITNHTILTNFDAITRALIEKLTQYNYPYVLIIPDLTEALQLHDLGYSVMLGDLDDPKTYQAARVDQALLIASTDTDQVNANVAFTAREVSETVPIIALANNHAAVDILQLAGCNHVLEVAEMLSQILARQVVNDVTKAHVVGQFDDLMIAEAAARNTSLVNKTLAETQLRQQTGLNVLGIWVRGVFEVATPDTRITPETTLLLAGAQEHLRTYNQLFCKPTPPDAMALIIGGGRVGRAVGRMLGAKGIDYRIVEKDPNRVRPQLASKYVVGDGAELEVLEEAGIREANSILITTHDDDMNVYLTIYCRRLRADAQIISRAVLERNVSTLHRAGADFVMSYATTGANAIINLIGRDNILMISEGLEMFEVDIPANLVGKSLAEADVRRKTGVTVVARYENGHPTVTLDPHEPLPADTRLILIGTPDAEKLFLKHYKPD